MGSNMPFICMEYCDMGDLRKVGVVGCWVWTMNPWGVICRSSVWSTAIWETSERWVWGLDYEPMGNNMPFICMEYCDMGDLRKVGVVGCGA